MPTQETHILFWMLEVFTALVMVVVLGLFVFASIACVQDVRQLNQTIRRNFPVVGRFRYTSHDPALRRGSTPTTRRSGWRTTSAAW